MVNFKVVQKIAKYGLRLTLTRELQMIGVDEGDKVIVSVENGTISIRKPN
jgi:antitoxin component of MazEF toxin-antitoxin module